MKIGSSKAVEILPWNLSLRLIELWVVLQFRAPVIYPAFLPANRVRHLRPNRTDIHFECSPSLQPTTPLNCLVILALFQGCPNSQSGYRLYICVVSVGLDKPLLAGRCCVVGREKEKRFWNPFPGNERRSTFQILLAAYLWRHTNTHTHTHTHTHTTKIL